MEKSGKKNAAAAATTENREAGKSTDRKPRGRSPAGAASPRAGSKSKAAGKSSARSKSSVQGKNAKVANAKATGKSSKVDKSKGRKSSGSPASKAKGKKGEEQKDKKGKKSMDSAAKDESKVGKPTRPVNAYLFFSNEMIPKIKAEEGIDHKAAMSRAGEKWNKLTEAEKKKYEDMKEAAMKIYEKQMKEFKDKGYYLLPDGTKSSDVHVAGKKKRAEKSEQKPAGKRKSALTKDDKSPAKKRAASVKKPQPTAKGGKSQKSQKDELDLESDHNSDECSV